MTSYVALLRGINVGGHRKVPMADLRTLAKEIGLERPRTYVASGNLLFESDLGAAEAEQAIERAIEDKFGFPVDVIVRSAEQWSAYAARNPFPQESEDAPNLVMISIGKAAPQPDDIAAVRSRASANERLELVGDAVWIYFGDGARRSKIGTGPARHIATTRNWRSIVKIAELLEAQL